MSSITAGILVILCLLLLNGLFSMSELAVVSARRTRLEHRAERGDAGARAALDLAANPTAFLSTVQFGITLVGVLAGAFGGAELTAGLAASLRDVPWVGSHAEPVAFGIVVSAITYLSLVVGELVPKQLALRSPERIAALVARPMRALARVGAPLVGLLTGSTHLVFRVFGIRATIDPSVTEQDIRAMVEQGAEAGAVTPAEHEIVENTFVLGDRRVSSIMTPRLDVPWVDAAASPEALRAQLAGTRRAPYLVCDGDVERVLGFAWAEDLFARCLTDGTADLRASLPTALRAVLHEPLFVPGTLPVLRLLDTFRRSHRHAAVVLDEFGGVAGMATVDDILEALVGELPEPGDTAPAEIMRQTDGSWLVDGRTAFADLSWPIDLDVPADGAASEFDTVGGLVIARLGRLPNAGEAVDYAGARFTVERMDGRRIVSVRVRLLGHADRRPTPT